MLSHRGIEWGWVFVRWKRLYLRHGCAVQRRQRGSSFQNETLCPIICVNPARQPKGRTFSLSYRDRPCAALTAEWFGCELGRLPLTEGPGRGCAAYRTVLRRWVARATNSLSTNINQILSKICSAFNRSKHNHSSERCVPGLRREATPKAECWL